MNETNQLNLESLLPLKQQEIDLLHLLRKKYPYGNVEILMRDGVPVDVLRTVNRVRLGHLSTEDLDKNT